ncbi:MAG: hypothetical protein AB1512_27110 [Thermodesulfobacteriota bacterium]
MKIRYTIAALLLFIIGFTATGCVYYHHDHYRGHPGYYYDRHYDRGHGHYRGKWDRR